MKTNSRFSYFFAFVLGALFFVCVDYLFPGFYHKNIATFAPLRESTLSNSGSKYKFIDPLLAISRPDNYTSPEFVQLKKTVEEYLSKEEKNNNLEIASVYFRGQKNTAGFTINPKEKYGMASLIKVPIMISYFKLAQRDPETLNKKIKYDGSFDFNSIREIQSTNKLMVGREYKVSELIDYMIKYSDNNAYSLLANNLNITDTYTYANDLFNDFGIEDISLDKDNMDINSYSLFFRVLYNSTYLGRTYSEKALEILSETDYKGGMRAGIPDDITISNKFAEATIKNNSGQVVGKEFHNCGLVYYPDYPFILCMMTKGNDLNKLQKIVTDVSKMIYEYYDAK